MVAAGTINELLVEEVVVAVVDLVTKVVMVVGLLVVWWR